VILISLEDARGSTRFAFKQPRAEAGTVATFAARGLRWQFEGTVALMY
jgi:hypothetical protein